MSKQMFLSYICCWDWEAIVSSDLSNKSELSTKTRSVNVAFRSADSVFVPHYYSKLEFKQSLNRLSA